MKAIRSHNSTQASFRKILGVRFFVGNAPEAVAIGVRGGLMVAPSAPALVELERDHDYRQALLASDLAITDSGFLVLLWNTFTSDRINRVSGLEYLRLLLSHTDFQQPGAVFWVMPSQASLERNLNWLRTKGYGTARSHCYVAPKYPEFSIRDDALLKQIETQAPRHVVICLGGGIQEKLGFYLKGNCKCQPAIHCIGAAIGFLTGDQVRIPTWADRWLLGWLFRCASKPNRFIPRYTRALQLPLVLLRNSGGMSSSSPRADL